jgi:hypothetical protein
MGSIREQIETVYAALAFIERNAVQEAKPLLDDLDRLTRKDKRARKTQNQAKRPEMRAE